MKTHAKAEQLEYLSHPTDKPYLNLTLDCSLEKYWDSYDLDTGVEKIECYGDKTVHIGKENEKVYLGIPFPHLTSYPS